MTEASADPDGHWKQQLQTLLLQSQRANLGPAPAVDYFAVRVCGMSERNWARERDVSVQAIRSNVKKETHLIDMWAEDTPEFTGGESDA